MQNYEKITSAQNQYIKKIRLLRMRKYRKKEQIFVVEGLRTIIEAIYHNQSIIKIFFTETIKKNAHFNKIVNNSSLKDIQYYEITKELAQMISGKENPQQAIAIVRMWKNSIEDLTKAHTTIHHGRYLALDRVRDPGNLGTILRSADAAGVHDIVFIDDCVDPFCQESVRASMGSLFATRIYYMKNDEFIEKMKMLRWNISIAVPHEGKDYFTASYKNPHLLVMGNESQGVNESLYSLPHQAITIPMQGRADSLNLASSTSILLFRMLRD